MTYTKQTWIDEVLDGSPTYNISGTGAGQTIALENVKTVTGSEFSALRMNHIEDGIEDFNGAGVPTAYTPVFTGITLGNGTVSGSYIEIGKKISGYASVIFGSTTAITGSVTVTLPKNHTGHVIQPLGLVTLRNTGVKQVAGIIHGNTASTGLIRYFKTDTNYVSQQAITTSLPFVMGENDAIVIQLEYIGA